MRRLAIRPEWEMEIPTRLESVSLSFCDEATRWELPMVTAFLPELELATLFSFDGRKGSTLAKAIPFWPLTGVSFSETQLGVGDGELSASGERVFFGDGDGVGDFFSDDAVFFFRCGVGVGVEKIFLRVLPKESSAASIAGAATARETTKIRARKIM